MSTSYRTVGWNANKRRYDTVAVSLAAASIALFVAIQAIADPSLTIETLLIRALGATAFLLLHVILCIGPLARLDARFLPLLYNRRHLGVLMCTLALAHGGLGLVQFHTAGTIDPLVNLLAADGRYGEVGRFPFQVLGLAALAILGLMAATSHDFWLHQLTAPVWKALHMGVYLAYASIVLHVLFGVAAEETQPWLLGLLAAGALLVFGLHAIAGRREARRDRPAGATGDTSAAGTSGFVDVCHVDDIPERRAVITCLAGERVAVFRYEGRVSALSNVCQHQNGPLGEGRIVNDCVVCPWHGYEYLPASGASPAPFVERVPTFDVRVTGGRVLVHPTPHPPGTRVEPARIEPACIEDGTA
jgi:sulfoxide reductase heme-binding subunit YedZ